MGNVQFPQESELANSTHHRVSIELNIRELSETDELLKYFLEYLQTHQSPPPSSTINAPTAELPDLLQHFRTDYIPTYLQSISPVQSPSFQSTSNIPSSHYQSIANIPTSLSQSFFSGPVSPYSISIPKSIPSPIGTKKACSSPFASHASTPTSSTSHCPPIQDLRRLNVSSCSTHELSENQGAVSGSDINLAKTQLEQPRVNVSSCSTHGLSENQGAVSGSDINLAKIQLEQPNITGNISQVKTQLVQPNISGKISQELVEEPELNSPAAKGSRDQGEDRTGVNTSVRIPEKSSTWRRQHPTHAIKHNRKTITAMCYLPYFEDFSNNSDDSSGWLISSSEECLNLWQCTSRSSVSEPSLQFKSSQKTKFVMEDMVVDMDAKFLCAFCPDPKRNALCITKHTLGGPAIFKYEGMIRIPCEDVSLCTKKSSYRLKMLHLASLHHLGGAFGNSVAAAFDKNIHVYDLSSVSESPSVIVPPKTMWQAHDSPISCMHLNSFCSLITGSSDGYIRLWDMKAEPCNPVREYRQKGQKDRITCIEMLDGTTMCSSSQDGTFQLHDIRYSASPFMSVIPNEKPIFNMASIPMNNTVACTTEDRLFCLELESSNPMVDDATSRHSSSGSTTSINSSSSSLCLRPLPSNELSTGIKWNTRTCTEIYTSQTDGSIAIFAK
ncbi:uncharacterized protein LOC131071380 isoform X2 [Cryptomeria japonica]|uniref:uncharacterized protein LOC131071380 isoform X2 n=1 Tax=Cryptomeria japonica TaxID=3369 RepID=UPI0027DA5D91|nr:uncharacterized protein LOC131071380 isoform X2 [Cryptomeria japonica]